MGNAITEIKKFQNFVNPSQTFEHFVLGATVPMAHQ